MNRRFIIFEPNSTSQEKTRIALSSLVHQPVTMGNQALAVAPNPDDYTFVFTHSFKELLKYVRDSVMDAQPFAGCLISRPFATAGGVEALRDAHKQDPNLQFLVSGIIEESAKADLNQIFGTDRGQLWDVLNEDASALTLKHKVEILSKRWEREHLLTEQLIRSERIASVGMLAAGIGHEVGNILLRIVGRAEVAIAKNDPKEFEETLRIIVKAALRGGDIIRSLQSASKRQETLYNGSIQAAIQDSLNLILYEYKEAGIEVLERYEDPPTVLNFNRAELAQVFLNLFVNAKHAMEISGGSLTIETRSVLDGCQTSIRDTGCGIRPEQMHRIFEAQFTTKGDKGNGFGLSISKTIIEKHGGTLTVTSEVGKGTEFRIFLPKESK